MASFDIVAVDHYCERLGPGLWAEPLNATTNLAFLVAAWFLWRLARERRALTPGVWLLVVLMAAVGIGSGLFHTVANTLTEWLDIVPILAFQLVFLWLYFRGLVGLGGVVAAGILVAFVAAALVGEAFPDVLNGSLLYAPTVITLAILGVYHYRKSLDGRYLLLIGTGVFLASLTFRTMDASVCERLPVGTHFLWHLFNATLLYVVARAYVVNVRRISGP